MIDSILAKPGSSSDIYSETDFTPVYGRWGQAGSVLNGILSLEETLSDEESMRSYKLAYEGFWQLTEETAVKHGKLKHLEILLNTEVKAFDCTIRDIVAGITPASGLLKFIKK